MSQFGTMNDLYSFVLSTFFVRSTSRIADVYPPLLHVKADMYTTENDSNHLMVERRPVKGVLV